MYNNYLKLFFSFLLFNISAYSQSNINAADSAFVVEKMLFDSLIQKGVSFYKIPSVPKGYSIELIGSDNFCVINKAAKVFAPLTDVTVNLLFKVVKLIDKSYLEIPVAIQVKGKYNNDEGINLKPFVIPSLREWHGGAGQFILTVKSRIVLDKNYASILMPAAKIFQKDLLERCKINPAIVIGVPLTGDILISLNGNKVEFGAEGYLLNIKNYVVIIAANYKGAFEATRSVLQIFEQHTKQFTIAKGIARDYPKYEVRGFMLDVGRKYFTIDILRDYVKLLSYYKMSDFQLHLSDNAFARHYNNNWDSTYSGFRLESTTYPQLPTKGEFYTKKEFIDLQLLAESYGVNIIPEIDVPAHSLAFSKAFPQIASKVYGKDHLDINNPETYTIIENVFKEYLEGKNPVFRYKEVHIGTDEYAKKEAESFRKFTDHFAKYVQSFGKAVRVWGALTHAKGTTPVTTKNITMNAWYNGYADPKEMKKLGYPLISTPDGLLYIVPAAGYYNDYLNLKSLYNTWEPVVVDEEIFKMGDPFIRGGMFAVWNDVAKNGITAQDVTDRVFPALQVLSQKMWSGANPSVNYTTFSARAKHISEPPGLNLKGIISGKDSLVINYLLQGKDSIKLHNAAYTKDGYSTVLNFKNSHSFIELPYNEIGYNYTVSFSIMPSANNSANAIIFQSNHAIVKLKQGNTGNLGFSHEGKDYDFGISIPDSEWSNIIISGDNNATTLYLNNKLIKKLSREQISLGYKDEKIWVMKTLFFPLKIMGDSANSFIGKMKDLKVFNVLLKQVELMK